MADKGFPLMLLIVSGFYIWFQYQLGNAMYIQYDWWRLWAPTLVNKEEMEDGLLDDFEAMTSEWDRVDHESVGLLRDVLAHLRDGKEGNSPYSYESINL